MRESINSLLIVLLLPVLGHAGFNFGAINAVKKTVEKLDNKVERAQSIKGGEWVLVPGDAVIGTSNFYVMKYEAKNVGGLATSQADAAPWVDISLQSAIAACSALGSGAHLVTIPEAQTINRNIEAQPANWANGVVGSLISAGGGLKRGNADVNNSASYIGSQPEFGNGRNTKAQHVLSNSSVIWDWSGNVSELIYGAGTGGTTLGTPNGVTFDQGGEIQWNSAVPDLSQERLILGPSNASYTSLNGVGTYYVTAPTNLNGLRRGGGYWITPPAAGVFSIGLIAPDGPHFSIGFRCAR